MTLKDQSSHFPIETINAEVVRLSFWLYEHLHKISILLEGVKFPLLAAVFLCSHQNGGLKQNLQEELQRN